MGGVVGVPRRGIPLAACAGNPGGANDTARAALALGLIVVDAGPAARLAHTDAYETPDVGTVAVWCSGRMFGAGDAGNEEEEERRGAGEGEGDEDDDEDGLVCVEWVTGERAEGEPEREGGGVAWAWWVRAVEDVDVALLAGVDVSGP